VTGGRVAAPRLPRRRVEQPPDLSRAVEHARILRAAGDAAGAARVLDAAFAAEGVRTRAVSERVRFRALVLRADLAIALHDEVAAARYLAGAEWFLAGADFLPRVADAIAALDEDVHRVGELLGRLDAERS
jgi:hypothetical protein